MKVKQTNSHGKPTIQQPNNGEKKKTSSMQHTQPNC